VALATAVAVGAGLFRWLPIGPAFSGVAEPPQHTPPDQRAELRAAWRRRACVATHETMSMVARVVSEQLGVDESKVTASSTFSALGADSLDVVETVMALEEQFEVELPDAVDIELPDERPARLRTMQDLADLIQSRFDEWAHDRAAKSPRSMVAVS